MSAFATIFTALSDPETAPAWIKRVAAYAAACDAHLDVLSLGVDHTRYGAYDMAGSAVILHESLSHAADQAQLCATLAKDLLEQEAIRASVEMELVPFADVGRCAGRQARFSDLVILPQPYAADMPAEQEAITEAALFEAGAPVLVLPENGADAARPREITIAWNQSAEAMRAVRAALPFLRAAERCHVVLVDPPAHGASRSDPGGRLAQWLSRHGVAVDISVLNRSMPRVADVLSRHLTDTGSEMLVMGAYGHSRFREAILGGATRDMLEQAQVPVFMTH